MEQEAKVSVFRWAKLIFWLLLAPETFKNAALDYDIEKEFQRNVQWNQQYPDRQLPEDELNKERNRVNWQTSGLRESVGKGFLYSSPVLVFALLSLLIFRFPKPASWVLCFILSTFFALWSTLGNVGRKHATIHEDTLVEQANTVWYKLLQVVAAVLVVIGILNSYLG